jgi:hypothetical protein
MQIKITTIWVTEDQAYWGTFRGPGTEGGIGADNERHENDKANENQHQANKSKQPMQVHRNDLAKFS